MHLIYVILHLKRFPKAFFLQDSQIFLFFLHLNKEKKNQKYGTKLYETLQLYENIL